MTDEPKPPRPLPPVNLDQLFTQIARAIRSHTNAIRLLDAKVVAIARSDGEILSALSSRQAHDSAEADLLRERVDLALEVSRDARDAAREILRVLRDQGHELDEVEDRLKGKIEDLGDRITPLSVPLVPAVPLLPAHVTGQTGPVQAIPENTEEKIKRTLGAAVYELGRRALPHALKAIGAGLGAGTAYRAIEWIRHLLGW